MNIKEKFYLILAKTKDPHQLLIEQKTLGLYKKLRKVYFNYQKGIIDNHVSNQEFYNFGFNGNIPYLEASYSDYLSDIDFTFMRELAKKDNLNLIISEDALSNFPENIYLEESLPEKTIARS